jgi:hypothetical protein
VGRLCERPGCSDVGVIGYGFDADRLLVWLDALDPATPRDELRGGVLCRRHADAMVVPRGWTLDDHREAKPRLFRSPPTAAAAKRKPPAGRRRSRPPVASADRTEPTLPTVAEVTGESSTADDPDATVAMPWVPAFDEDDDLDGLLRAETPLLARAFRGTERRR